MKILLADQLIEAEQHRDELQAAGGDPVRLHRAEGMVLTLSLLKITENDFREFMRQRRTTKQEAENG